MSTRTVRIFENTLIIAGTLWIIWSWWSFTGIYRLIAIAELRLFGSFGTIMTFLLSIVIMTLLLAGIMALLQRVSGTKPPVQRRRSPDEVKIIMDALALRGALLLGVAALAVTLVSGYGIWRYYRNLPNIATFNLSSPVPLPPNTGAVHLRGFTKPELLVGIVTKNTPGVDSNETKYMAIVGPGWKRGQVVPIVVQGSPGLGLRGQSGTAALQTSLPYLLEKGSIRSTSSGFAAYLLERAGAPTNGETLFLDTDADAERNLLFTICGLAAVLSLTGFLMIFLGLRAKSALALTGDQSSTRRRP